MRKSAKKIAKKRSGRRKEEAPVRHVIEFTDWEFDYMFGIDPPGKFSDGPYMDYRHLNAKGKLLRPLNLHPDFAEVTLFPDHRLSDVEVRRKHEPEFVGVISHWGKDYRVNLHFPADIFGHILQMLIAGRYRYVVIDAVKSNRGEALVQSFRFTGAWDDEDDATGRDK